MGKPTPPKHLPRPHKRPSQARSQFTVQVIYDAFVRIWRRDGPAAASMRCIADEAGYAVGTLYEYFPNREALLSGYFRHCLDDLSRRLTEADADDDRPWRTRLRGLVSASLDEAAQAPYFDGEMLLQESAIADLPEHRRAFGRLCDTWERQMSRWADAPGLDRAAIEALVVSVWGARRYAILLGLPQSTRDEVDRTTAMLEARLTRAAKHPAATGA